MKRTRLRPARGLPGLALLMMCCAWPVAAEDAPKPDTAQAEAGKGDAAKGNEDTGRKLYNRYCRGCHGEEGKGDGLVFMPHVDNLTRKGYIDLLPDAYLYTAIAKGGLAIGKSSYMPAWEGTLTEQQINDILAYIRSLPLH